MSSDNPPSLEDLARAAVEAWRKWCDADRDYTAPEFADVAAAIVALENRLEAPPGADARLMAAAPDLLAACKAALPLVHLLGLKLNDPSNILETHNFMCDAIDRAEGKEPTDAR